MKILLVGDLHCKPDNLPEMDLLKTKLLQLIDQNNFEFVVFMGDTLHSHEKIQMLAYNKAIEIIFSISSKVPLYLLIGNHDRINNQQMLTHEHPFVCLENQENIHVIWKPESFDISGHKFIFVPYVPVGRYHEALQGLLTEKKIELNQVTSIFSHQEFRGCKIGNKSSENGDPYPLDYPINFSGHIHGYERVQKNLLYCGVPLQTAFDESIDKTVSIIEFDLSKDPIFTEFRVDLELPKKITFHLNYTQVLDFKLPEKDKVRLIIKATAAEIKLLFKNAKIQELQKKGVKIVYKTIEDQKIEKVYQEFVPKKEIRSYHNILTERINNMPELLSLYKDINQ